MRRALEIVWGAVLLIIATSVLTWIAYSLTLSKEPAKYPWWWTLILIALWSYTIRVAILRLRGRGAKRTGNET